MKRCDRGLSSRFRLGTPLAFYKGDLKPHLSRYWLTPPEDDQKDATIRAICEVYQQARHWRNKENTR